MKRQWLISCFTCVFGLTVFSHAQAVPTATKSGTLQLGIGGSIISPDYSQYKPKAISIYTDFDFRRHIGIEGEIHYDLTKPSGVGESTYLVGPRLFMTRSIFTPYAKALIGMGTISYQLPPKPNYSENYMAYAFGGGVDIRVTHYLNVRAIDFELQKWPGFTPHTLSPYVTTIGVAYSFP